MRGFQSPMTLFACASLMPFGLLGLGLVLGGFWVVLPLVYITAFAAVLDQTIPAVNPKGEDAEFPAGDGLLVTLALCHLAALPIAVWGVAGPSGLMGWERAIFGLGSGLTFGQVSNPVAHELIHRGNRWLFQLGLVIYVSLLFGHHTSAHRLVHHRHAASMADPNTARAGEGYYHFARRAWLGSFRAGLAAETARRVQGRGLHPYWVYLGGAIVALILGYLLAGWPGVAVWAVLSGHAQVQLLLADYVQHYGLMRAVGPDGRPEPVSDRHSWNAPHWFSARLMLNAPRHSDHHAHPARPYAALRLPGDDEAPMLPYPLPLCCTIALIPPVWRQVIDPRLARWRRPI
jgi:alkane 1-monooxygenase